MRPNYHKQLTDANLFHTSSRVGAVSLKGTTHCTALSLCPSTLLTRATNNQSDLVQYVSLLSINILVFINCNGEDWLHTHIITERQRAELHPECRFSRNCSFLSCACALCNDRAVVESSLSSSTQEVECVSGTEAEQPPILVHQQRRQWRGPRRARSLWLLTSVWRGSYQDQRSTEAAFSWKTASAWVFTFYFIPMTYVIIICLGVGCLSSWRTVQQDFFK